MVVSWLGKSLQEVADSLDGLDAVTSHLPAHFELILTDEAGNDERAAYVYSHVAYV